MGSVMSLYWRAIFCMQQAATSLESCNHTLRTPPASCRAAPYAHVARRLWRFPPPGAAALHACCLRAGPLAMACRAPRSSTPLLLGCIPVFFHPGQRLQWPWHWGAWVDNATVTLDLRRTSDGSLDPVAALADVPAHQIATTQATIAAHGHACTTIARTTRCWAQRPPNAHYASCRAPSTSRYRAAGCTRAASTEPTYAHPCYRHAACVAGCTAVRSGGGAGSFLYHISGQRCAIGPLY